MDTLLPLVAPLFVPLVKIAILIGALMTAAAYLVLLERWIAAWVQDRLGPNRVGPLGLLQPLADGLKFIFKEEYTPGHVDKFLFILAPIVILTAALAIFAVIPFGSVLPPLGLEQYGVKDPIRLIVAPGVDVGLVYVFALSSVAVYGVILGAWASNSKYSFLGGLRSSAQLIAYEIPLGLGILGVILYSGSLDLDQIISAQATSGVWNAFTQPLGFVVFMVASFAESARLPFDLPECEQELIGGYHTEYAGMKLLLFLIAEFLHMVVAAFLIVILFFGGWHLWGVTGSGDKVTWFEAIARIVVLVAKIMAAIVFFMMVRWSWPRFRFDQLMSLAWKVMLPLGLLNLAAVAVISETMQSAESPTSPWIVAAWGWAVLVVGWIGAALAAPLHDDNRPRQNTREFDVEEEIASGAKP
ncbi:MAG TPA: NADH-quinone oxidoreductase subunit NuoH [Pirellulales bacterium]|jgi:NADH-quinone oxidoreductase subunit H|nr:NADH-quinone oxidoreductase subunit NuoH [Pirellulales bacterium]